MSWSYSQVLPKWYHEEQNESVDASQPQVPVQVHYWPIDPAFGFVQLFEHQVANQKSTEQEKCINTWQSIINGLKPERFKLFEQSWNTICR